MYGRPALDYDPECSKSIDDAIDVLKDLRENHHENWDEFNIGVWASACAFFGLHVIYLTVNMICYGNRWCREECCCHSKCCFISNKIVYASISLFISMGMLVLASLAMGFVYPKYTNLSKWSDYSECVDGYMQIDDSQSDDLTFMANASISVASLSIMIAGLSIFSLISNIGFACRDSC